MNDNDLERLVNLLSYLKKHDDVESEIQKRRGERPAPGERKTTPWERWQTGQSSTAAPLGGAVHPGKSGYSTAAGGSARAYQTNEEEALTAFPSTLPDPSTQEIRDRVATSTPSVPGEEEIYVSEKEKEFEGPRGGSKGYQSSTPEGQEREVVTPPDPDPSDDSDTSEGPSMDEMKTFFDWMKDNGYTPDSVKGLVGSLKPRDFENSIVKSNETIVLKAFRLLGM
jgi:hypothetical protein